MIPLTGRNVNGLWAQGMQLLAAYGERSDSRNGPVLVMPTPVVSVYDRPCERVLMDPVRDANPFFHLMESLWMLAGRDDAAFLDRYVGDFGSRFAEDNHRIHGAYGWRWRHAMGYDQLDVVVAKLRANPDDRQCVIQMWDAQPDESDDLRGAWKDRPCNTHVYLRVRKEHNYAPMPILGATDRTGRRYEYSVLDLTVCCRSNDIVWGAYGANAVHFSVLQEYLAGRIGVGIGKMYQFSNNYHGYEAVLGKFGDPALMVPASDPYAKGTVSAVPMGTNWDMWDYDLRRFIDWHDGLLWDKGPPQERPVYINSWFSDVATNIAVANRLWKMSKRDEARASAEAIAAPDWRAACVAWMQRRMK